MKENLYPNRDTIIPHINIKEDLKDWGGDKDNAFKQKLLNDEHKKNSFVVPGKQTVDEISEAVDSTPLINRLQRENAALRDKLGVLRASQEGLNRSLRQTQQENIALKVAKMEAERIATANSARLTQLGQDNESLRRENANLRAKQTESVDRLDPKGYCRALGIESRLLHTLSPDKLEKLLLSLRRAYTQVYHPDVGGTNEAMRVFNEAYDFLRDPQKRASYGR